MSTIIRYDLQRQAAPKCVHCGHPVQPAIRAWKYGTGPAPKPGRWTHGIGRQSGYWQGRRCPGRLTGATPPPELLPQNQSED